MQTSRISESCHGTFAGGRFGSFLAPSLPTAMEELASTPDAKAHNRYAAL
jgi:hypothetical protein